jgi:hypothetical protein
MKVIPGNQTDALGIVAAIDNVKGVKTYYVIITTTRMSGDGYLAPSTLNDLDYRYAVSILSSDVTDLEEMLSNIVKSMGESVPSQERFRFTSKTELPLRPANFSIDSKDRSSVSVESIAQPVWITSFDLVFQNNPNGWHGTLSVSTPDDIQQFEIGGHEILNLRSRIFSAIESLQADGMTVVSH